MWKQGGMAGDKEFYPQSDLLSNINFQSDCHPEESWQSQAT